MKENSIIFKPDTAERKRFFKVASFSHPAKMILGLQIYLIENYTKTGETILDPMAGSGTALIGCTLGRNMILVELEDKFVKMQQDNWTKIKSLGPMLGHRMGQATILQGDARNLDGLLADNILFSPPYAVTGVGDWQTGRAEFQKWVINELATKGYVEWQGKRYTELEWRKLNHGRIDGRTTKGVHKHPTDGYSNNPSNIANLSYGAIDAVISSPPFAGDKGGEKGMLVNDPKRKDGNLYRTYCSAKGNIDNLPYEADAVITSPPYEGTIDRTKNGTKRGIRSRMYDKGKEYGMYADQASDNNIGNLKSENYLQAMFLVYHQCHKVLKLDGVMCIVVKNFIRDKKIVRLDLDTIKLCEQAGFILKERLKRKLTQQSFWRVIYAKKYPNVEQIKHEYILIFAKL